ncbi:cyclic pyranopterin monophosphate synthase subunit MoaA [Maledivibacter halophilus]|uniref:Cyclic pyranopterin monophosphate synthase subunit MoaA n=2 Tax=Maledivibacter halophilus TaxID=36842 RepID=A0A1T5JJK5_9FIRM|nr:cyclic pyranopterin monophosphate synthase subunit MoaA [Maledivibacter halophilus]
MPKEGICKKFHKDILRIEEIEEIVRQSVKIGIKKVRITGGEPLIRNGIIELVKRISSIDGIEDLAMTTNGILLKKYARDLKSAGLNRVNISIDSLDKEKYREITRGGNIEDVMAGIKAAKDFDLTPIKLNTVLIGRFNDDEIEDFVYLTQNEKIDVRFIELMPLGEASSWAKEHFIPNTTVLDRFPNLIPLKSEDKSSPAKHYKLPGGKGKVGLINPISSHFCSYCNRIRITSDGKIKPCLHSNYEINIKNLIKQNYEIIDILRFAVEAKPKEHNINNINYEPIIRNMFQIGG